MTTDDQQTSLVLDPWETSFLCSIDWIHIKERLGGELANGRVSLKIPRTEEIYEKIISQNTGRIYLEDLRDNGYCFDIPIFITTRDYIRDSLLLDFVCVEDPSFFCDLVSGEYENITKAIQSIYPDYNMKVESDQNNENTIIQKKESNYMLLNRLCNSYKAGTVYGFTWTGELVFKDILGISSRDLDEKIITNLPQIINLTSTRPYSITYNRQQNYPIINPWDDNDGDSTDNYSEMMPKNVISVMGDRYYICRKGYENMLGNYLKNTVQLATDFNGNYSIAGTEMPKKYRLGDVIRYYRPEDEDNGKKESIYFTKCLVYSNELFFGNGLERVGPNGFNFDWTTEVRVIEDGPWTKASDEEVNNISAGI